MADALVVYEARPPAVVLTINRPDKRNALNRALMAALAESIQRAGEDDRARSVILTGADPAFCAGMDLAELGATVGSRGEADTVWADACTLATLFDQIYKLPKPTIAAVNGPAIAGGAGLVSVCDLALSVPTAKFGYPEVRRGLVAALVMPHLLRHVGERAARYMLLTGELIDAFEAARVGLVNAVVPADHLMARAFDWAAALAEGGPVALATTKRLLDRFSRQEGSIRQLAEASAEPRLGDECREGLKAFFEKRPAPWAR
jgi:methylglutaconyl-CoA hydratase